LKSDVIVRGTGRDSEFFSANDFVFEQATAGGNRVVCSTTMDMGEIDGRAFFKSEGGRFFYTIDAAMVQPNS
jgi:hypothetical protein